MPGPWHTVGNRVGMTLPLWGPQASLEPLGSAGVTATPTSLQGLLRRDPDTPLSSDHMAHWSGAVAHGAWAGVGAAHRHQWVRVPVRRVLAETTADAGDRDNCLVIWFLLALVSHPGLRLCLGLGATVHPATQQEAAPHCELGKQPSSRAPVWEIRPPHSLERQQWPV